MKNKITLQDILGEEKYSKVEMFKVEGTTDDEKARDITTKLEKFINKRERGEHPIYKKGGDWRFRYTTWDIMEIGTSLYVIVTFDLTEWMTSEEYYRDRDTD